MIDYWTEDVLPPLPSPQRVLLRGGVAMVSLLGVGFGLGWVAAPQRPETPYAAQSCPMPNDACEVRAVAVEVPMAPGERPAQIGSDQEPTLPNIMTLPVERDVQFK